MPFDAEKFASGYLASAPRIPTTDYHDAGLLRNAVMRRCVRLSGKLCEMDAPGLSVAEREDIIDALGYLAETYSDPKPEPGPDPEPAFWLVWRDGGQIPMFKHSEQGEAEQEAERLARANPGQHFYVLPALRFVSCEITPPKWDEAAPEPPF